MKILVNCALPYANGSLHPGHIAGAYMSADVFVRFQRLMGNTVLYISGSDEHGTPTTITADKEGVDPFVVSSRFHEEHTETFRNLDINFDLFGRTTDPGHRETTLEFFKDFYAQNLLPERTMISPYCPKDRRFLPDRYVEGICPHCGFDQARGDQCDNCGRTLDPQDLRSPRCILCGTEPEFRETRHLFFRLDLFRDRLLEWLDTKDFWKPNVRSFAMNYVKGGLKERPFTRDINWGISIPVDGYENKRIYVWFEALIGYVSGARAYSESIGKPDYWKEFYFDPEVRNYYFMGKDNVIFHAVIWPAMLMAKGGYNLPYLVAANEHMMFGGRQFSKSRKIGYSINELLKFVHKDYLRFYLALNLPEGGDSDFTLEDLQSRVNTELIDKFGNFIHRIVTFVVNSGIEPKMDQGNLDESDRGVLAGAGAILSRFKEYLENVEIKKALAEWLELVRLSNVYFNDSAPWSLKKSNPEKCAVKLFVSLCLAQMESAMIYPFIPSSAEKVLSTIGSKKYGLNGVTTGLFDLEGSAFTPRRSDPPFAKLDITGKNPNFADLKIGQIMTVRNHPSADKLYLISVDLGYRQAQLVAGLRPYYKSEELIGRKIVLVDNLKWAKLRGEESQGMLLAADDGKRVSLIRPESEEAKPETPLRIGDYDYNTGGKIDIDKLRELKLHAETFEGAVRIVAELDGETFPINVSGAFFTTYEDVPPGSIVR